MFLLLKVTSWLIIFVNVHELEILVYGICAHAHTKSQFEILPSVGYNKKGLLLTLDHSIQRISFMPVIFHFNYSYFFNQDWIPPVVRTVLYFNCLRIPACFINPSIWPSIFFSFWYKTENKVWKWLFFFKRKQNLSHSCFLSLLSCTAFHFMLLFDLS